MTIYLHSAFTTGLTTLAAGTVQSLSAAIESAAVAAGRALYVDSQTRALSVLQDSLGRIAGLLDADGSVAMFPTAAIDASGNMVGVVGPGGATDVVPVSRDDVDVLRARFQGRNPGRLILCGTSFADGTGASNAETTSFRGLLNSRYAGRLTPFNAAQGGSSTGQHITRYLLQFGTSTQNPDTPRVTASAAASAAPLNSGDIIAYEMGYNDWNIGNGTMRAKACLRKVFEATLAFMCVPAANRVSVWNPLNPFTSVGAAQLNPAWTLTGGWTFPRNIGGPDDAKYRINYGTGTTDTLTTTVTGDTIYVIHWVSSGQAAGVRVMSIDGVDYHMDSDRNAAAPMPGSVNWVPYLMRVPVSPGSHTIALRQTTGAGGILGSVVSEVFAFNRGRVQGPTVLVMPAQSALPLAFAGQPRSAATLGWTDPNSRWTDEGEIESLRRMVREAVRVLQYDGWQIALVENGRYDPNVHISGDNVHPNDQGHRAIFEPFADAIDRLLGTK